jgi:adenylyltransferase/sulfurtransferase
MNIIIPTSLRPHTGGAIRVKVMGQTVDAALDELVKTYPEMRTQLFDESGTLVSFINIFVNDENIRDLDHGATSLAKSDEILLVPAIAGG